MYNLMTTTNQIACKGLESVADCHELAIWLGLPEYWIDSKGYGIRIAYLNQ